MQRKGRAPQKSGVSDPAEYIRPLLSVNVYIIILPREGQDRGSGKIKLSRRESGAVWVLAMSQV